MYIPRGKITTTEAVERLFELRQSDEATQMRPLKEEERLLLIRASKMPSCAPRPPPPLGASGLHFGADDRERRDSNLALRAELEVRLQTLRQALSKFHSAICTAGSNLRDALAEGDLTAIALQDDGSLFEVPVSFWRKRDALRNVMNGFEMMRPRECHLELNVRFFVEEKDFVSWAQCPADSVAEAETKGVNRNSRTQRPRPTQNAVDIAMLKFMQEAARTGSKATQSQAYCACKVAFYAPVAPTDGQMRRAFGLIPKDLKRERGAKKRIIGRP
jgi:hypothetical protein